MTSFLEEVMRDSYRLAKRVWAVGKYRKQIDEEMAFIRMDLMKANRFVLDDDFVRVATEVSCRTNVMETLQRLQGSLLPYERTWIEFNPRVKVETSRRVLADSNPVDLAPIEQTVDRMGLLLRRGDDSTRWTATLFVPTRIMSRDVGPGGTTISNAHGELAVVSPAAFLFDARGRDFLADPKMGRVWTFRQSVMDCPDVASMIQEDAAADDLFVEMEDILKAELWGFWSSRDPRTSCTILPEVLETHAAAGVTPFFRRMLGLFDRSKRKDDLVHWLDQYRAEVREHTGLMRWLVGVLCILNEVPIEVREVRASPEGTRRPSVVSNSRRHFDHSVVTLKLPRVKNVYRYVARKMVGGIRKRRHTVEEHWRTYLSKEPCPIDEGLPVPVRHHAWEVDHDAGYRLCRTCGSYGRLIHEHQRGDISLGWVTKEFRVTSKEEKRDEQGE